MHIAIAAHRHPCHAFSAAGHNDVVDAGGNGAYGDMNGGFGRAAFAVHRHAGNGLGPAGRQQCRAGDIAALFADLGHAAEHHVLDLIGADAGARHQFIQDRRAQMVGPDSFEAATESPDRCAGGLDNNNFTHQNTLTAECGIFAPWSS